MTSVTSATCLRQPFQHQLFSFVTEADDRTTSCEPCPTCGANVAPLDGYPECNLLLGWKQSNNGDSFIASPVEIPHLAVGQIYPPSKDRAPRPD